MENSSALFASPYDDSSLTIKKSRKNVLYHYMHPWMPSFNFVYLSDENEDPFKSSIKISSKGIVVPEDIGNKRFAINAKWFVEGFGYLFLSADNGGRYYTSNDFPENSNLNFEFAKSRIYRNRSVKNKYEFEGTKFSIEIEHLTALSEEIFADAVKKINDREKSVKLADLALNYALIVGEKIEIERAESVINKKKRKDKVLFGCETRQYIWAQSEGFKKAFEELFNFATITHYVWDTWYELFEPREGVYNWGIKDNIVNWLAEKNITIEGRPLFWFHPSVTPEWLKNKSYFELKKYVEKHTHDLVSHYGGKVSRWEIINEYHDWANIHNHTPEQTLEIVRLACDKTKEVNPDALRIINNCAPWGEYSALGMTAAFNSDNSLRSPRKFISDLVDSGTDFDILGIQVYFPERDLSDIVRMLERMEKFNKPIYITEMGASSGPTKEMIASGEMKLPGQPYDWHRYWDEELQADWLEKVYSIYFSRPSIKAINWYDFSDFRPHIKNGGLIRENSTTKKSYMKLKDLLTSWDQLPV